MSGVKHGEGWRRLLEHIEGLRRVSKDIGALAMGEWTVWRRVMMVRTMRRVCSDQSPNRTPSLRAKDPRAE